MLKDAFTWNVHGWCAIFLHRFKLFSPCGLEVSVDASWLLLSIVFHETAHSLVARHYGVPIRGITLFIFGGVTEMSVEPNRPHDEFWMAAAGCFVPCCGRGAAIWSGRHASPAGSSVVSPSRR